MSEKIAIYTARVGELYCSGLARIDVLSHDAALCT